MRWPWHRQKAVEEAALEDAERDLTAVRARRPHVEEVVETMRLHRQRNHFAERIEAIYTGRRP